MTNIVFDISMSLDGCITGPQQTAEEPLGRGGEQLHHWAFGGDDRDREVLEEGARSSGAVITGRRNYDDSLPWWGADGPTGDTRLPVFVLTHDPQRSSPEGGVYRFVADVHQAVAEASDAAGGKAVTIMGGASSARAFFAAGLVDEISLHMVPVILGAGTRLFTDGVLVGARLENVSAVQTAAATHLRVRVVRDA